MKVPRPTCRHTWPSDSSTPIGLAQFRPGDAEQRAQLALGRQAVVQAQRLLAEIGAQAQQRVAL